MNQKMVFLKTLLIIYPKNDKQSMVMKVCSRPTKQIFLKISQNSQENTSAGVSSNKKFAGLQPATLLNKRLQERCFPVNFAKLNNTFLTKRLRPTRPMPKFQPTPPTPFFLIHAKILWTHATYAKISTHATYQVNFFGPMLPTPPALFSRLATDVCSFTAAFILYGTIASASN